MRQLNQSHEIGIESYPWIKIMLQKLYFKFLRWKHDGIPSPKECDWALQNYDHTEKIQRALRLRAVGWSVEHIAELTICTRERIRQILLKGIRQAQGYR